MVFRNVMLLILASLLLLAFASERGEAMSPEKEEGTSIKRKLLSFFNKKKEETSTSISQTSSSSPSIVKAASLESEPYKFDLKRPPQASDIQAFERTWIPHFLSNPNAIDLKGYYKLVLKAEDIHPMFQADKRSKVSQALQASSASPTREYIACGAVLEASFRTTLIDSEWQSIFRENANKLYAVFVSSEFRDTTTSHIKGKIAEEKSGTIVKYAAFRWEEDGRISAIRHPLVEENILTFLVSYREKNK